MPRLSNEERLKRLQQRRDQLNAQLAALEARNRQTEKKRADRRKILVGALVLTDLPERADLMAYLAERLPSFLTRQEDKMLFADLLPQDDRGLPTSIPPGGDAT